MATLIIGMMSFVVGILLAKEISILSIIFLVLAGVAWGRTRAADVNADIDTTVPPWTW